MYKQLLDKDFSPSVYPFVRQTSQDTWVGENLFIAKKLPSDCGIICLFRFRVLSPSFIRTTEERQNVAKNNRALLKAQVLGFLENPGLMWSDTYSGSKERAGVVVASLNDKQALGAPGLYFTYEDVLLECGFKPLITSLNGNSNNDVRMYGYVFPDKKPTKDWTTKEEVLYV